MKATAQVGALHAAVRRAASAVAARPMSPALTGLLLTVAGDLLTVRGTDLDVTRTATVPVEAGTDGTALAPARLLEQVLSRLPDADVVDLTVSNGRLHLSCGRAQVALPTQRVEDFPAMPPLPAEVGRIAADSLRAALACVSVAASTDLSLPQLTALRLEAQDGRLRMAATDRYRLHVADLPWTGPDLTAQPPARSFTGAVKAMTGELRLLATDGRVGLADERSAAVMNEIALEYPPYARLLRPADDDTASCTVDADDLQAAVQRMQPLVPPKGSVRLTLTAEGIDLTAADVDAGGEDFAPADTEGDANLHLQPAFILDALAGLDGQVRIGFGRGMQPVSLRDEHDRTVMLMPVKPPVGS